MKAPKIHLTTSSFMVMKARFMSTAEELLPTPKAHQIHLSVQKIGGCRISAQAIAATGLIAFVVVNDQWLMFLSEPIPASFAV